MDNQKNKVYKDINSWINNLSDNCVNMIFVNIIITTKTYDIVKKSFIIRLVNSLLAIPKFKVQS